MNMRLISPLYLILCACNPAAAYQPNAKHPPSRRTFLARTAASLVLMPHAVAAAADIKVTPLAHTFITSSSAIKPIRENDATRYFTNAKVVYLLGDTTADVIELTQQRKAGQGPGVTPGNVVVMDAFDGIDGVASQAKAMSASDVLLVGPVKSKGVAADGKLIADTASALGVAVGGKSGGGVISVLVDGPRQGVAVEEGGFPISDLLWFSIASK